MAKIPELNYVTLDQLMERSTSRDVVNVSLSADISLGGGIPFGATCIFAGKPKTGKTTTALQIAANAQKKFPEVEVEYYNKERRLTKKVLSQINGLDNERTKIIEPADIKNKAGEVIGQETWSSETWLQHLGNSIEQSRKKILIFDSISSLSSEKQLSEEVGYQDRGASKKVETSFYQKYGDLVVPNEHILIFIAQGYSNTSGYGKNFLIKIGNSINYQADLITVVNKVEKWPEHKDLGRSLGHTALFEVFESPLGPPDETMRVPIRYGHGIDIEKDAFELGVEWGLIKKGGSWYTMLIDQNGEETEEGEKFQGEVQARNYFVSNPDMLTVLQNKIREIVWPEEISHE